MRLDFPGLQAFLAIAERGSFHKAAAHLGITQTALSHRIKKFEDYLGVALFHRTTRQVSLTPSGLELLPRARTLVDDARRTFADLSNKAAGRQERVAIGCLPTITMHFLPRVLSKFLTSHPSVVVRVFDNSADEIAERVQKGDAEFAISMLTSNRWDLEIRPLVKEYYVLLCRANHRFARLSSIRWRDLSGESLVRISAPTGHRVLIDDALGAISERLTWTCEVQHVASAVSLVAAGVGMTIVPRVAIDVARALNLSAVPLRSPAVTRTLGSVTRRGVPLTPLAAELLQLIETHLTHRAKIHDVVNS